MSSDESAASDPPSSPDPQMSAPEATDRPLRDPLHVGALAKGLRLLRAFDDAHCDLSLAQLARRTKLDKSAVQRLAHTLTAEGFLEKSPATRRFRPSHAWLELAHAYCWSDPLVGHAMPRLIELSRELGESINMAEISGDRIIYVARLPSTRAHFAATVIGRRLPALVTSSGRAILSTWPPTERAQAIAGWTTRAFTPRTTVDRDTIAALVETAAQQGFSVSRDEVILGEIGIAAPVPDPSGHARAAVHCSVSGYRWTEDEIRRRILPPLLDTANAITPLGRP